MAMRHTIVLLAALAAAAPRLAAEAAPRSAVVRVEAALNPFSAGPSLAAELGARPGWTPYEQELARRLRVGSTGTGFFVNSRGDLVTNAHVVLGGVRYPGLRFTHTQWDSMERLLLAIRDLWITVQVGEEERAYLARPVAVAEDLDLAVLRVLRPPGDETEFAFLPIGDSAAVSLGDHIHALGYLDDSYSATPGVILSLVRGGRVHEEMQIVRDVDPVTGQTRVTVSGLTEGPVLRLQHSAQTGPGSSGGPLVDARGRVIGLCYALLAQRGPTAEADPAHASLHLAIASNVLRMFLRRHAIPFTEAKR